VTAFVCAFAFTRWTPSLNALLIVVPFGFAASALITALYLVIGLLAFWLQDVAPIYWVWQKLMFVLGGLMLPLEVYPEFIQHAAVLTPFPSLLAAPASFVLGTSLMTPGALVRNLILWSGATAFAVSWMFRHIVSDVTINGG
jgi:viologen exporter family transport system permease protein